jgi:hypothetical protein
LDEKRVSESEEERVSVDEFIVLGPLLPSKRSIQAAQQLAILLVFTIVKENHLMNGEAARGLHLWRSIKLPPWDITFRIPPAGNIQDRVTCWNASLLMAFCLQGMYGFLVSDEVVKRASHCFTPRGDHFRDLFV